MLFKEGTLLTVGMRAIHMEHVYDFYKPNLSSEFPVVDGKKSITCYLNSLDICYQQLKQKVSSKNDFTLDDIDFLCSHSPFVKLVQKSVGRLFFGDFLKDSSPDTSKEGKYAGLESYKLVEQFFCYVATTDWNFIINCFRGRTLGDTLTDKEVERACVKASLKVYNSKTYESTLLGREVGNMYTASVYGGLVGLLARSVHLLCCSRFFVPIFICFWFSL